MPLPLPINSFCQMLLPASMLVSRGITFEIVADIAWYHLGE